MVRKGEVVVVVVIGGGGCASIFGGFSGIEWIGWMDGVRWVFCCGEDVSIGKMDQGMQDMIYQINREFYSEMYFSHTCALLVAELVAIYLGCWVHMSETSILCLSVCTMKIPFQSRCARRRTRGIYQQLPLRPRDDAFAFILRHVLGMPFVRFQDQVCANPPPPILA